MAEPKVAQASVQLSTPERQTAKVFNVAEYKKQLAAARAAGNKQGGAVTKKSASAEPKTPTRAASTPGTKALMKVRAKYDYTARDDTEVSFKKGDTLTVYGQHSKGWWFVRKRGEKETLLGPANYFKQKK